MGNSSKGETKKPEAFRCMKSDHSGNYGLYDKVHSGVVPLIEVGFDCVVNEFLATVEIT